MTVLEQAQAIRREAATHKRNAQRERRAAQQSMERLRMFCEQNGINFEVIVRSDKDNGTANYPGQ